jgi:anaerobic ribonucleoside-triphosphate reductase activating protein
MQGSVARICTSFIDIPGRIAVVVYLAGCSIRCKGCQNPALWDSRNGTLMSVEEVLQKIEEHPLADSVVFLGGEPTDQIEFLTALCQKVKKVSGKDIMLYTGREFENLPESLVEHMHIIVCGPFREDLLTQSWPASSNQRIFRKKDGSWQH